MTPIPVYIGFDPSETIAWHVLCHSIMRRSSIPVKFVPLMLGSLKVLHKRNRDPLQSTEFSFTRFLVPYLNGFHGKAVYMDCDMMVKGDIKELIDSADPLCAVSVVKHDYKPQETIKMLGATQTQYHMKNWSSVMVFSCGGCIGLTPEYVDKATGLELHQFHWLNGRPIGELPHEWNHLVGYDQEGKYAIKNLHWTSGGPWWQRYCNAPYSDEWRLELEDMNKAYERNTKKA